MVFAEPYTLNMLAWVQVLSATGTGVATAVMGLAEADYVTIKVHTLLQVDCIRYKFITVWYKHKMPWYKTVV